MWGGESRWSKDGGERAAQGDEKGGTGDSRFCVSCVAKGHIAVVCPKNCSKGLNELDEGDENTLEEVHGHEDELHAWVHAGKSEKFTLAKGEQHADKKEIDIGGSHLTAER